MIIMGGGQVSAIVIIEEDMVERVNEALSREFTREVWKKRAKY